MTIKSVKESGTRVLLFVFCFLSFLCQSRDTYGITLDPQNVKEIAIYTSLPGVVRYLEPDQINFNITDPLVITSMVSSVEFSTERNCSDIGALADGIVYVKFKNDSIEVYDLFGRWSHLSKIGMWGSCHYVSEQGRALFETNAQ